MSLPSVVVIVSVVMAVAFDITIVLFGDVFVDVVKVDDLVTAVVCSSSSRHSAFRSRGFDFES